jgi:anti-sigma factor RsiW
MLNFGCWLTRRRLGARADGELPSRARARIDLHLARCPACAAELVRLSRLRAALAVRAPEPPEAVWDAFWPQVRARLAETARPEPVERRVWGPILAHPRLAFGSAVAVAALALVAILTSWQPITVPEAPRVAEGPAPTSPPASGVLPVAAPAVVIQSVETAPDSSAMVFTNPDTDVTVVWVFGLERTDI